MSDECYGHIVCHRKNANGSFITSQGTVTEISMTDIRSIIGLTKTLKEIKETLKLIECFLGEDYAKVKEEETRLLEKDE